MKNLKIKEVKEYYIIKHIPTATYFDQWGGRNILDARRYDNKRGAKLGKLHLYYHTIPDFDSYYGKNPIKADIDKDCEIVKVEVTIEYISDTKNILTIEEIDESII